MFVQMFYKYFKAFKLVVQTVEICLSQSMRSLRTYTVV